MTNKVKICLLSVFLILVTAVRPAVAESLPDFVTLVENNTEAVVNISTTAKKNDNAPPGLNMPDIPENSPFYDFFKKYFGEMPEGTVPFEERSSLGSGFIISKDGYVITNNHVVKDADEVIVRLNDRREYVAKIIGTDERSDIAVLKIDATDLPIVKLGDSGKIKVGQWVLAIGSPFGFDHTVTKGIISAIGRSLPNDNYVPFIQTDVAINPGNSGGPLFNMNGEVIGVNSQIYSRTGGFMGLSFAVPIDVVSNVYQQLRTKGRVSRGWLGVLIQDVTRELAESFGMDHPHGALIAKVLPGSPADTAGFEVGDVIVDFNGNDITFSSDLPPMVGNTKTGESVPVKIIRKGKKQTLKVTIAELPEESVIAQNGGGRPLAPGESTSNRLDIVVANPTAAQRKALDLEDYGVIVSSVSSGPGSQAGIRQGDVILLINNVKIKNIRQFNKEVSALPNDKSIPVLIQRQGDPIFLAFRLKDERP